jgi:hypothetical protein
MRPIPTRLTILLSIAIVAAGALILNAMGRVWICTCGSVKLWLGDIVSSEGSQHLTDWYTFTHIIHGFLFYLGLWFLLRRWPLSIRFLIAVFGEMGWEVVENTPWIIDKYRAGTISLNYFGDSVVNSVGDVLAMIAGFWLAAKLPVWASVAIVVVIEVVLALVIRDNLTLNVIMLWFPIEAVRVWQSGGG